MNDTARLLITCDDRPGIVASVSNFLYSHGANITALDQHSTDPEGGEFFMRLEFQTPHLDLSKPALENAFKEVVAERFDMTWSVSYAAQLKRMAILVSKEDHALTELLWRWRQGKLPAELTMVISNHPDLRESVEGFGVPYHHVAVDKENKAQSEAEILRLMEGKTDLVVLARYMQILSGPTCEALQGRVINIHHSFLPGFKGARPYHQAHERGVKLIGATAHFVTEDLDDGPIIEQEVQRVDHSLTADQMAAVGRDIEAQVLARALSAVLDDRVLLNGTRTVVLR